MSDQTVEQVSWTQEIILTDFLKWIIWFTEKIRLKIMICSQHNTTLFLTQSYDSLNTLHESYGALLWCFCVLLEFRMSSWDRFVSLLSVYSSLLQVVGFFVKFRVWTIDVFSSLSFIALPGSEACACCPTVSVVTHGLNHRIICADFFSSSTLVEKSFASFCVWQLMALCHSVEAVIAEAKKERKWGNVIPYAKKESDAKEQLELNGKMDSEVYKSHGTYIVLIKFSCADERNDSCGDAVTVL